jgi:hypothetical protein
VAVSRYLVNKIGKMPWILLISRAKPKGRRKAGRLLLESAAAKTKKAGARPAFP